ncbi:hypothetical protein D3C77_366230 [compost metagenome]
MHSKKAGGLPTSLKNAMNIRGGNKDARIKNIPIQIDIPRILRVEFGNSRQMSFTKFGGFASMEGDGTLEGDSFGPERSYFQPGDGLSRKGGLMVI